MKYNPEIHHRRSVRLPGYDYGQGGLYFITICAWQRQCIFGAIEDGEMHLNSMGEIARDEWLRTAKMRLNIGIAEFVVMPNHVHGIISIRDNPGFNDAVDGNDSGFNDVNGRGTMHRAPTIGTDDDNEPHNRVEKFGKPASNTIPMIVDGNDSGFNDVNGRGTMHRAPTIGTDDDNEPHNRVEKFGKPTSNTIPTIIRGYKAAVTTRVNILRNSPQCPVWQRNYYENVVRSEADYLRIANYILNNPRQWQEDSLHHEK